MFSLLIKELELINYTNYRHETIVFHPYLNLLIGSNAQGKSNLIDSIFFLGLGRSHRHNQDALLIRWGEEYFRLQGYVQNQRGNLIIEHAVKKGRKMIKINGASINKLNQLIGQLQIIIFTPNDLALIKEGPEERRRFLNRKIVQLKPLYYDNSLSYQRILSQRNKLLKSGQVKLPEIQIWDEQLSHYGSLIMTERNETLKKLAPIAREIHEKLSGGQEDLVISYQPNINSEEIENREILQNTFLEQLNKALKADCRRGFTSVGPHRDDFNCFINDIDMRIYGSQGQQRTGVLTLKLAMLQLMKEETGEYPVLLLDDVFSELDQKRREYLLHTVSHTTQTIITATDLASLNKEEFQEGKIFNIADGKIS